MDQSKSKVIALVSGVVCAICVVLFMQSVQGGAEAQRAEVLAKYGGSQVDVLVAKRDISAGERVEPSMIESRSWVRPRYAAVKCFFKSVSRNQKASFPFLRERPPSAFPLRQCRRWEAGYPLACTSTSMRQAGRRPALSQKTSRCLLSRKTARACRLRRLG